MTDWTTTDLLLNGLYALIVFGAGYVVAGWLTGAVNLALERTPIDPIVRRLIVSLVRPVIIAIGVFAALSIIGIPMTTFAAMAGAVTLAVGLSMQSSFSNVASGALLLTLRPFSADDTITAAGHTGKVRSLKLFCTVLDTPDGNTITIPNDVVFKSPITTFTTTPTGRIDLTWVVTPDADLDKVRDLALEALTSSPLILEDPAPTITFSGQTDFGIEIVGRGWALNEDKLAARSAIQRVALQSFQRAKVPLAMRKH